MLTSCLERASVLVLFGHFYCLIVLLLLLFCLFSEESEATSKHILAKSAQIRTYQEENKNLGQLVRPQYTFSVPQIIASVSANLWCYVRNIHSRSRKSLP